MLAQKESLRIYELLSTGFSPCLLLIPRRAAPAEPTREFSEFDCKNAPVPSVFLLELQGLDQPLLSGTGNQVPVWMNLQSSTNVLCLLGEIWVCTQTHTGRVHPCPFILNINQIGSFKCSDANYAVYFSLYDMNVIPLNPHKNQSQISPPKPAENVSLVMEISTAMSAELSAAHF